MFQNTPVSFSGVQPSGNLTIGNYLGAIKNFSTYSEKYKCFYCVVDEHAITVRQVPADLRRRTYETPYMPFSIGVHALTVDNRLDTEGILKLDYIIEIKGGCAERCEMTMTIREAGQ